jgi:hypothetical protein
MRFRRKDMIRCRKKSGFGTTAPATETLCNGLNIRRRQMAVGRGPYESPDAAVLFICCAVVKARIETGSAANTTVSRMT